MTDEAIFELLLYIYIDKCVISGTETYFSDTPIPDNPSEFINGLRYLNPRMEQSNDAYAVQSTAYALMTHIKHNGMGTSSQTKIERDSMMRWLNLMRNFIGGMASTQVKTVLLEFALKLVGMHSGGGGLRILDISLKHKISLPLLSVCS